LHMQLTWKQNSIVWFTQFDYGERLIHHISTQHVWSHKVHPHVELFVLHFTLCFVKALWWGVTRFALPHVHTCSVLMSSLPFTVYLKNYNENFQKILFLCNSSHNFAAKRNELRYHCCLAITTVFHRALVSCCSRKIE
jgi:hypothetical protein